MDAEIGRVVALGASNLTRGFHTVVTTARAAWGPEVEVLAALGHGRSYGVHSTFLVRKLPGILECGLWRQLGRSAALPTRALITDVGNDILYGYSAQQTLDWVGEALVRLLRFTRDIVLTDLPIDSIRRSSRAKFYALRSLYVPSCRLSYERLLETAERVNAGLAGLAADRGARFCHLHESWYGFDPIHIRPALWREAWQEILGGPRAAVDRRASGAEVLRVYLMRPERRWLFGVEQATPQVGTRLPSGARIWLY